MIILNTNPQNVMIQLSFSLEKGHGPSIEQHRVFLFQVWLNFILSVVYYRKQENLKVDNISVCCVVIISLGEERYPSFEHIRVPFSQ